MEDGGPLMAHHRAHTLAIVCPFTRVSAGNQSTRGHLVIRGDNPDVRYFSAIGHAGRAGQSADDAERRRFDGSRQRYCESRAAS